MSNDADNMPEDGLSALLREASEADSTSKRAVSPFLPKPSEARPPRKRNDILATTVQAPKNRHEWHSKTETNMFRVETLTQNVFAQVNQNSAMEQAAKKAVQEHAKREREKQRVKVNAGVKEHEEFIRKTYKCMKEIEYAIVQVEGAQGRLIAERYARFAGIKVCEYRMELRAKRPPQELFRDQVQRLLEKEGDVLNMAREDLLKQEKEAKRVMAELRRDWDDLAKDIGNRRLAMRYDLSSVNEGQDCELYTSDDISDAKSNDIVKHAYDVSVSALQINDFSFVLVKRTKSEAAAINKQVGICLAAHTKELATMKASLARKIVDSEGAIDKAGTQLNHMEQRVEMGDKAMAEMVKTLKALLRDLNGTRQKTIEDLRNKTAALDIDNSCRKVTAQMASASNPAPKKLGPGLGQSASAPNLPTPKSATAQQGQWKLTPSGEPTFHGNPQQGDFPEHGQAVARFGHNRPSPSNAGGSNPLKAAAAASGLKAH